MSTSPGSPYAYERKLLAAKRAPRLRSANQPGGDGHSGAGSPSPCHDRGRPQPSLASTGGDVHPSHQEIPRADLFQAQLAVVLLRNPVALAGGVFKFLAVHDLHCATGVLDKPLLLQNTSCQAHARPIRP
jgi:hypothetical protein